ncbi:MAG: hypothetical protein HQM03_02455 [Magnetococcales bacterium]|nr:hypothetical protein [Magnetococcales bacterium]
MRIWPGLALLMLLGGAGLGFAYGALARMGEWLGMLADASGNATVAIVGMRSAMERMGSLLDLLVVTWGGGFALIGWEVWRASRREQPEEREKRLTRLIRESGEAQQNAWRRVEEALTHKPPPEPMPPPPTPVPDPGALIPVPPPFPAYRADAPPPVAPRLALEAPAAPDKHDEDFEPF